MKKATITKVLTTMTAATMIIGMTGCGSSAGNTDMTGYYTSNQNVNFMSAYPDYTFKQATFGIQTLEVYSDGTYCLTDTESSFSGTLTFADDGTHEEVPRGASSTKYYGTYTQTDESGLLSVTLSAPTSVAVASNYSVGDTAMGYIDTKSWTDEMGTIVGGEEGVMTADEYLTSVAFDETVLIVDSTTDSFDYFVLNAEE